MSHAAAWTDAQIADLRVLWYRGLSRQQIAIGLSAKWGRKVSIGMISGKCDRMVAAGELARRPAPKSYLRASMSDPGGAG